MSFKIYRFELKHRHLPIKQGFLLESSEGRWSEVSPLPGRSKETLEETLEQLHAVQRGWKGPLFPSVAFGVYGLTAPLISSAPCALLLHGSPEEVIATAAESQGCTTAKIKVGHWREGQAVEIIQLLSHRFHLRIDFNSLWNKDDINHFCSQLLRDRIEFLEDPGFSIDGFCVASDAEHYSSVSIRVWKPMVLGLPEVGQPLILSSALESSIGLQLIASLLISHNIPTHALGLGTLAHLEEDLVANPAWLEEGKIHFPSFWKVNRNKLAPC